MPEEGIVRTNGNIGIIWSSARAVRRSLNWGNERNPCRVLQVSHGTAQPSGLLGKLGLLGDWVARFLDAQIPRNPEIQLT